MSQSLNDLSPATVRRVQVSQSMKASRSINDPVPDPAVPYDSAPTLSCNLAVVQNSYSGRRNHRNKSWKQVQKSTDR